jgi:hypothetical protein
MSATSPPLPRVPCKPHPRPASSSQVIGHYTDRHGRARELACLPGMYRSTLVIDRLAATLTDARLIAHLAADEPAENALLVSKLYLADGRGRCCRTLTAQDLKNAPPTAAADTVACHESALETDQAQPVDAQGRVYRLQPTPAEMSIPELRWQRQPPTSSDHPYETVSDQRGNISGETSWLARRIGQLPEGGHSTPTPWIHSDTLALIARQGLRIAPRDVELD